MADGNGSNGTAFVSRKNERVCTSCHRPFWAWEEVHRKRCYVCQPMPKAKTERVVREAKL